MSDDIETVLTALYSNGLDDADESDATLVVEAIGLAALKAQNEELRNDLVRSSEDMGRICAENEALKTAATDLVAAVDRLNLRQIVAGWNGEDLPEAQRFGPHHDELGVRLPTNCGTVYAIDRATEAARAAINPAPATSPQSCTPQSPETGA